MKASCSWLRSLLPQLDASAAAIGERLSLAGWQVVSSAEISLPSLDEAAAPSCDVILDLVTPPGRVDVSGHIGLAREVAALFGQSLEPPPINAPARVAGGGDLHDLVDLRLTEVERCPHYALAGALEVEVQASPLWLRRRLETLGIEPAHNVADVAALLQAEFGHPVMALSLDAIGGQRLTVRRAHRGERLVTADGVERWLAEDDLVLAHARAPLALAGVLEGQAVRVREGTSRVLLECAHYEPAGISGTCRRHGLLTAASRLHERGTDPEVITDVIQHGLSLLTRLCSGAAVPGIILTGRPAPEPRLITLRRAELSAGAGGDLGLAEAAQILARLGFRVRRQAKEPAELEALVPSHRPDIRQPHELAAEVIRAWRASRGLGAPSCYSAKS